MKTQINVIKTSVLGGFLVVLPMALLIFLATWVYSLLSRILSPFTSIFNTQSGFQTFLANGLVFVALAILCFAVGVVVRTRIGGWIFETLESALLKQIPGYSLIKETVLQFFGGKQTPFSSVALVRIFGNETMVTAFITDHHENGLITVFVPTGPNPTSGNIYHLKPEFVHPVSIPVEDAMRSIIGCGAGSAKLLKKITLPPVS